MKTPAAMAPTAVTDPAAAGPVGMTTYTDGMISVSDAAPRNLPVASNNAPTRSPNPAATRKVVQRRTRPVQAAPTQTAPPRSTIPAGRGVQIHGVQSWPGAAAPTQFYATAQAMPLQHMPLANVPSASEGVLRAAFQQRLDAVHTSAGTYLPPNQPTSQMNSPAVNAAR